MFSVVGERTNSRLFYKEDRDANVAPENMRGIAPISNGSEIVNENKEQSIATTPSGFPLVQFPQWKRTQDDAVSQDSHHHALTVGAQVAVTNITATQWFHMEFAATKQQQDEEASPVIACVKTDGQQHAIAAAIIGISINRHSPMISMNQFLNDYYDGQTLPSRALIHLLGLGRVSLIMHDEKNHDAHPSARSSWYIRDEEMPLASPVHNIEKLANWASKLQRLHQERQRLVAKLMQAQARLSFLNPVDVNTKEVSSNQFLQDCDGIGKLFEKAHIRALKEEEEANQNSPDNKLMVEMTNATQDIMADIMVSLQTSKPDVAPTATEYASFEQALRETSSTSNSASNSWGPPDLFTNPESFAVAREQSSAVTMQDQKEDEEKLNEFESNSNQKTTAESVPVILRGDQSEQTTVDLTDMENFGMGFDVLSFLTLPTMTKRCLNHLPNNMQSVLQKHEDEQELLFYEIFSFVAMASLRDFQHPQSETWMATTDQQSSNTLDRLQLAHEIMLTHVQLLKEKKGTLFAQLEQFGESW